jgi:outer membrane protein assembly factor BamB
MAAGAERARRWARAVGLGLLWASLVLPAAEGADADPRTGTGSAGAPAEDVGIWPSFRGPGGRGHAVHAKPPLTWSAEEGTNILWKTPVPTHGMSSPVVWGNRLFLTGADDSGRQIYCFDTDTGELRWRHDVDGVPGFPADSEPPVVLDQTGWAAPTPATDGRVVAAVFATGELVGVSLEGERLWARHLGVPENPYGHASSLMSHQSLLFVQYDQAEGSKLLAFDLMSGDPVWDVERDAISWSSPILVDNKGRVELILTNSSAVDGYDPASGTPLWHLECLGGEVGSSAAYADGIVFVSGEGTVGSALDIGGHGAEPAVLWQWDEALPDAASSLANDGYLVVPTGFGVVTCLEARTGKLLWEHDFDRGFWSSPIAVDDRVYLIDRSGAMQVFRLDDEFELLGVSEIGEGAYATPAFVGDRIYIRGLMHLFCIEATAD